MSADTELTSHKEVDFDPETYVSMYYSTVAGEVEEGDVLKFFLDGLNDAFKSGAITGAKLLDIGTGPTPHTTFCAVPWFDEITLSDFSQKNLEFLQKWKDGAVSHMGPVFEYLVQLDNSRPKLLILANTGYSFTLGSYKEPYEEKTLSFLSRRESHKLEGLLSHGVREEKVFPETRVTLFYITPHFAKDALRPAPSKNFSSGTLIQTLGSRAEERLDELKRKIKTIVRCDVTQSNPVSSTPVDGVVFDAITSSLCLEVASTNLEDYVESVRNLSSLLKPGGHLVLSGVLECTFYRVGNIRYKNIHITKDQLQDIYQKEGFEILSLKDLNENYAPHKDETYYSDFKNAFFMVAKKEEH